MKVNDFVECSEVASMDHVARLGRVTKVEVYAVHVTLFNGAHLIVDKGYVSPAPLLDVWRSIEEEIAKVEARAAEFASFEAKREPFSDVLSATVSDPSCQSLTKP